MENQYPIMIAGVLCGFVTVTARGQLTEFEAECRMQPGILRLSVYGEGREGYLGVLMPSEDGKLRLKKSLSRTAMRDFPGSIDHAGAAGETQEDKAAAKTFSPDKEEKPVQNPEPEVSAPGPEEECETEKNECEAEPGELPPGLEGRGIEPGSLYWYSSPDGALVCFDGERSLIALPPGDERVPKEPKGVRKQIEGREYMVYITKNGRIVG